MSVKAKAGYAKEQGLGGVMIWELGQDTAGGTLLGAAYEGLRGSSGAVRVSGLR